MVAEVLIQARPETAGRILDAAFDRISDVGLSRTTMEDVARSAGLARQTIYRYFPAKDHLIMALVLREEEKFIDGTKAAFAVADDLEQAIYDGTLFCLRFARQHPLLDRLLQTDPDTLLPFLTTRASPVVRRAREAFTDELTKKAWVRTAWLEEATDIAARMTISYALTPPDRPPEDIARDLAHIIAMALTGPELATR